MLLWASSPNIISMQQHTAYPFLRLGNPAASQVGLKICEPDTESVFGNVTLQGMRPLRWLVAWTHSQNS